VRKNLLLLYYYVALITSSTRCLVSTVGGLQTKLTLTLFCPHFVNPNPILSPFCPHFVPDLIAVSFFRIVYTARPDAGRLCYPNVKDFVFLHAKFCPHFVPG
jgi:hypothetical protein